MADTRDRLLDALEALLVEDGTAAATLEAVAARAGVSKGGLLYHFGSKEELFAGLTARLHERALQDATQMRDDADGATSALLRTSREVGDGFSRTLLATVRLLGARELDPAAHVAAALETTYDPLLAELGDPVMARLVQLASDGLYLHALVGAHRPGLDDAVAAHLEGLRPPAAG